MAPYPPPPRKLRGEAAVLVAPVRADAARTAGAGLPAGARLLSAAGWTLGGVLLARYDDTATLAYHELIVFSGLVVAGGRPAFAVSHIYVDSPQSLSGGHEIWGLPKELADFELTAHAARVSQAGAPLLHAALRRRRAPTLPVPLVAPVVGERDGQTLHAAGRGVLRRGAPVLARLDVPSASPFASLGLGGTRVGVAGDALDLHFPAAAPV